MFRQIAVRLFLGLVAVCGIIGFISCDNFEVLIIGTIDGELIEPEDNEWTGTWVLESYQGLSALKAVAEYDDYEDEDWTFLDADGSVVEGNLRGQAIAAFWSGDGVTGYDGSISYSFYDDGTMALDIVIRLQVQVGDIQGVLVGKDGIPGNYFLSGSAYTTEIADEVETGIWQRAGDTLTLNPDGADGSTVLKNYR